LLLFLATVYLSSWVWQLYQDIFKDVDGSNISQINRSALGSGQDQHALTYGEVELPECIRILQAAGARDNQIFVDLVSDRDKRFREHV
jgi:hypothetical protein